MRRTARTAADGVGAREKLEMGEEKKPLVMSELGCADGCGREIGAESGDEGAWLHGRRWTGNGCREVRGRLRTAWVQGSRWKRVENGGDKKPLVMSDLGCPDGNGRQMGGENGVDGCGRRGYKGVAGNGWGEEDAGDERPWLRGRLRTGNGCAENCADGCGRRGCNGVAGNSWGEKKPLGMSKLNWLRRRLRTGNSCGEVHGRLRTAWVQGSGWKWVGRRSR